MKKLIIALLFFLLLAAVAQAQPLPPIVNPVPLDGGILGLLAAGVAYGVKQVRHER
jgi:hypothetical protein